VQIADPPSKGDFGIGIGLYLVRVLVEAHEGTLMIHSEPGRGTVVTITFPSKRLATVASRKSVLTANPMASAH
jgi:signal transduction histidine kinase